MDKSALLAMLGSGGALAKHLLAFAPRVQQQEMAERVAQTLDEGGVLIAEAGTGTGKTFAYLLPALLSQRKVLISTGTKALQDQLFNKDLPILNKALRAPVRVALLKGRANYLCLHRLQLHGDDLSHNPMLSEEIHHVRQWRNKTRDGDIAGQPFVAEDSPVWPWVTSNADNCLGSDCPEHEHCFLMKARRSAQEADVVVVNHHLLFADLALRAEGVGELLPKVDAVIFDEAHQVPDVASQFFGVTLSSHRFLELVGDSQREAHVEAPDMSEFGPASDALSQAVSVWLAAMGTLESRAEWLPVLAQAPVTEALAQLQQQLQALALLLKAGAERGKGLDSCYRRVQELQGLLTFFRQVTDHSYIYWVEQRGRTVFVNATPMDIAERFGQLLGQSGQALIFTSATLAVNGNFSHFQQRLGLGEAQTAYWDSPFDYRRQAMLYAPPGLPEPRDPGFTRAMLEAALPVLEASKGRAFLLFTSHRALNEAAAWLAQRLPYPLFIQGRAPRGQLLDQFRSTPNGVLLGAASFWEGVDVRGEALSCVIIDKLPFVSPDDPVLKARVQFLRDQGKDAFWDYQLPQAVIALKQGVGRLIRDASDRGVMVICDPRLLSKAYGRTFLDSLPPMLRTRKIDKVQTFFASHDAHTTGH